MGLGRALKKANHHIAKAVQHYNKLPAPLRKGINGLAKAGVSVAAGAADRIAPGAGKKIQQGARQYEKAVNRVKKGGSIANAADLKARASGAIGAEMQRRAGGPVGSGGGGAGGPGGS